MALNNLKMFWLFVLLIVTCNCEPEKMKKCCKNSEMLNLDTVSCESKEKFRNVQNVNPNFPKVLPDFLFDIDGQPKKINNTLFSDEDLSIGFPKCSKSKYLSLDSGSGYFLTRLGKILSLGGEFEPTRDIGDFCLDFGIGLNSANISRVAVVCDTCRDQTCIQTCCPHNAGRFVVDNVSTSCLKTGRSFQPPTWKPVFETDSRSASVIKYLQLVIEKCVLE